MKDSKITLEGASCDICNCKPDIIYDAPHRTGPWAHFCQKCYDLYAVKGMLGTRHSTKAKKIVKRKETFEGWMKAVNLIFENKHDGMEVDDLLGDWNSRDMYDDGMSPLEAVNQLSEDCNSEFGSMYDEAFG